MIGTLLVDFTLKQLSFKGTLAIKFQSFITHSSFVNVYVVFYSSVSQFY
jgi:hypothetical protein